MTHASSLSLQDVLTDPRIWRGSTAQAPSAAELPTGDPGLDSQLPQGGWPRGVLTEILIQSYGYGELKRVLPALGALTRREQRVVCVAPPHTPHAPAWRQHGVDLSLLRILQLKHHGDALWASEQILRSGAVGAVLCWPGRVTDRQLRRLQLAAEHGCCWAFAFRAAAARHQSSPAALRLLLNADGCQVLKCRGRSISRTA